MEYYKYQLCINHAELTNGIISADMIKRYRRDNKITQVQRGGNGREALFVVESLPLKYKTEVYRRFPDMKAQAESKPFEESVKSSVEAFRFYATYKYGDDKYLSELRVLEYSNNAAILNAFSILFSSSKSGCGFSKMEFWRRAAQALPYIIIKFPHSLPKNPRRLQEKFNQYQNEGYSALITGKYGVRNAAKEE